MNKLKIKLANGHTLIAELCDYGGEIPPEIVAYVADEDGAVVQDVALVRANKEKPGAEILVWADEDYEDYTHRFVVNERQIEE